MEINTEPMLLPVKFSVENTIHTLTSSSIAMLYQSWWNSSTVPASKPNVWLFPRFPYANLCPWCHDCNCKVNNLHLAASSLPGNGGNFYRNHSARLFNCFEKSISHINIYIFLVLNRRCLLGCAAYQQPLKSWPGKMIWLYSFLPWVPGVLSTTSCGEKIENEVLVVLTRHGRDKCQQRQQHQCPTHSHHRRYHGRLSGLCQLQSALSISNGITDDRHGVFGLGWRHPGRTRSPTHRHPKWRKSSERSPQHFLFGRSIGGQTLAGCPQPWSSSRFWFHRPAHHTGQETDVEHWRREQQLQW